MKKLITLLFLVVIVLSAGAAYTYLSTKKVVDSMIESVRPIAQVQYQKFKNSMDGSVSIHGVTITDQSGDRITVDSIELTLDSPLDFIGIEKAINSGNIPPEFQLNVNHAYVGLELIQKREADNFELIASYIQALNCGDIDAITYDHLSDLGYPSIDGSINIDFEYNRLRSKANITVDMTLHGMESYSFKTSLPDIYSASDFTNKHKLNDFEFKIQSLGYNNKLIAFCSKQSGQSTTTYINQHMKQIKDYFTKANITLSDSIYDAYKAYFAEQASISFFSIPTTPINIDEIALYEASNWVNALGLTLYVNGNKVNNFQFDWNKETAVKALLKTRTLQQKLSPRTNTHSPATNTYPASSKQRTYVEVDVQSLVNHTGSDVKVETLLGKSYTGFIKGGTEGQVTIVVKLQGGNVEMPLNTDKIYKAYIYK